MLARLGFLKISPLAGARPFGMNVSLKPVHFSNLGALLCHAAAMISVRGKPSRAYRIAGSRMVVMGSVPNFLWSSNQPSTAPGTEMGSGPWLGILSRPSFLKCLSVREAGERPLAFSP